VPVSPAVTGPVVAAQLVATPPVMVHVRVPVGAPLPDVPVTMAVYVIGSPTVVVVKGEETTLIVGVALARLIGKIAEVAVR